MCTPLFTAGCQKAANTGVRPGICSACVVSTTATFNLENFGLCEVGTPDVEHVYKIICVCLCTICAHLFKEKTVLSFRDVNHLTMLVAYGHPAPHYQNQPKMARMCTFVKTKLTFLHDRVSHLLYVFNV